MLSEAEKASGWSALQRIAELAPTLKEAELRVLTHLASIAENNPHHTARASSRAIATATKLARSAVIRAIDSLTSRKLIATRQGKGQSASGFLITFLETLKISNPKWSSKRTTTPEQVVLFEDQGGPLGGPEWSLSRTTSGPFRGPLDVENKQTSQEGTDPLEQYFDDSILPIDRLSKANPKDYDKKLLDWARRSLHGYMAKFGQATHPPDDKILAQWLSIAPATTLDRLLFDLMGERRRMAYSYAWFIAVAFQRIHGIGPQALKERRQEIKEVHRQQPAPQATAGDNPSEEFTKQLIDTAASKVHSLGRRRKQDDPT
jgi:hypothetical protein